MWQQLNESGRLSTFDPHEQLLVGCTALVISQKESEGKFYMFTNTLSDMFDSTDIGNDTFILNACFKMRALDTDSTWSLASTQCTPA